MSDVYRDEDYKFGASITNDGSAATGLTLSGSLLDAAGSLVAGPVACTESPAGTYTVVIPASQTKAIAVDKVMRRLYAPSGGLDARDDAKRLVAVRYRPIET